MKTSLVVILALFATTACGVDPIGDTTPPGVDCDAAPKLCVDPRFQGVWDAGGEVKLASGAATPMQVELEMNVDGDLLSVRGFCPGGEGRIGITGTGSDLRWAGEVFCDFGELACPDARLWLTTGTASIDARGAVTIALYGQYIACEQYQLASLTLRAPSSY